MKNIFVLVAIRAGVVLVCAAHAVAAWSEPTTDCTSLARLKLKDMRILTAESVVGPTFSPPTDPVGAILPGETRPLHNLPAFCRVIAVISPSINFELWLPLHGWNGKLQGTGNGGYLGAILYDPLAAGLRRHYATVNTDMGHAVTSPDPGSWARGHPELVVDQGYRAQHETARKSKAIIRAFYHTAPRRSYFTGCSSGGWQGLTEAQRYPRDYDGIVAGAPAINVIHLHAAALWNQKALRDVASGKFRMVTDAVLAKCNANDGVRDGLLGDPSACNFSPRELACASAASPDKCLTPQEVVAFEKLYGGVHYASGESIYPGWPRGAEYAMEFVPNSEVLTALAASTFKDFALQNPTWDPQNINFDQDVRTADAKIGAIINGNSPDLRKFRRAGGKLILYHGWNDPLISPLNTTRYFVNVATVMANTGVTNESAIVGIQDFARLFLLPGVEHCTGGPGPDTFDALTALERWVEKGIAPESMTASHLTNGVLDRTRPLCPYPTVARYKGHGSSDDAASFDCAVGKEQ